VFFQHSNGLDDSVLVTLRRSAGSRRVILLTVPSRLIDSNGLPAGIAGATGTSRIVKRDLLNESGFARHDPQKLARALLEIYGAARHATAEQAVLR
jgi:hypothetical protein